MGAQLEQIDEEKQNRVSQVVQTEINAENG